MANTKKTKTERYYDWLKIQRKEANLAIEQKEKFRNELREISSM